MKYLKIYADFAACLTNLSYAERGRLFTAMLNYVATGEESDLSGNERFVWPVAKKNMDQARETYGRKAQTARENAQKRYGSISYDIVQNRAETHDAVQEKEKEKEKGARAREDAPPSSPPHRAISEGGGGRPLLTDGEMAAAADTYRQDRQSLLAAMERVGMRPTEKNVETALLLAAEHGAAHVLDALDKAAEHDTRGGVSWAYVRGILAKSAQKPKTKKVREYVYVNGDRVETVREVPV